MGHSILQTPALSEAFGGACPVEPPVWHRLHDSVASFPSRLAVASLHQPASLYGISPPCDSKAEYLRWSYAELNIAVERFAQSLTRLGAVRGKALATFVHNGIEFVLAFWAAHKIGMVFVPLNPRSLLNDNEVSHMLHTAGVAIVVVQDSTAAKRLDSISCDLGSIVSKVVLSDPVPDSSWSSFESLMCAGSESDIIDPTPDQTTDSQTEDEVLAVLFTSGTTSMPKGAPHTNTTLNAFCQNLSLGGRSETDIFCSVLPNNHAMGYFYVLHFMMNGAAIIYPNWTFDAEAILKALETENSTHMALVPAALYRVLEVLKERTTPLHSSLVDVCLAGSSITSGDLQSVVEQLKSKGVSTGFGMTEGSPIWMGRKENPEKLIRDNMTISGTATPGARIRICDPTSRELLPIGARGELHQSGPGLIKGYLGGVGKDQFYTDKDDIVWFITGDQAVMFEDKHVSISGRYKDIITRGSENISPAAIEATISRFLNIQTQVVGVADTLAGQVPVVIVDNTTKANLMDIHQVVLREMGAIYVPVEIISLRELDLDDFPKTVSGKVQKSRLASLVESFKKQSHDSSESAAATALTLSVKQSILNAYYRSTGIPVDNLNLDVPTSSFSDSIATMRVRSFVRKDLGLSLTIKEMAEHPTIASQIICLRDMLKDVKAGSNPNKPDLASSTSGPTIDEMSIMLGGVDQAMKMKGDVSKAVQSSGLDGGFNEVAAMFPAHDYMQMLVESGIINTWNFAIALITKTSSVQDLRQALKRALTNNPILTSLYVSDQCQDTHYVMLKPSSKLWDICILDGESLETTADVQQFAIQYPHLEHAKAPGPLFRCLVMHVEETNSAAVVMYLHHIVHDASSVRLFFEDIDQALMTPSKDLRPHVSFKAWAESFHTLRHSPEASASVRYHVNRLSNLHLHRKALYPPAPLPRKHSNENPDGYDTMFDAPDLLLLKKANPGITASAVLKAAIALVNVSRTGHSHALFNNMEAGRGPFPFIPESVKALNPTVMESSDVNGPTMQGVCNMIEVPHGEPAICLLRRLQAEQLELTKHAHAPHRRILADLAAEGNGAADIMVDVHRSHFLTWVPGFLGEYERLQVSQIAVRCAAGLAIVCGLGGPTATTYIFSMRWDVANFSRKETAEFVDDLEVAIRWLTAPDNWNKPVCHVLGILEKSQQTRQMEKDTNGTETVVLGDHNKVAVS